MKLSWLVKESIALIITVTSSTALLVWAIFEASNASSGYYELSLGFAGGFIPLLMEFINAYRSNTLFIKDKKTVAARKMKNQKLARVLLMPAVAFGLIFAYFPGSIRVILIGMASGYLLPYSLALVFHFIKHHKEIEKISRDI